MVRNLKFFAGVFAAQGFPCAFAQNLTKIQRPRLPIHRLIVSIFTALYQFVGMAYFWPFSKQNPYFGTPLAFEQLPVGTPVAPLITSFCAKFQ